jgi:hypothetical protein
MSKTYNLGLFTLSFDEDKIAEDLLLNSDDYLVRMTPNERAIRMLSSRTDITLQEFQKHVVEQIKKWSDDEIKKVLDDFTKIIKLLLPYKIVYPKILHLVKTSGEEDIREAGAYCRRDTIVLPQKTIDRGSYNTLLHEMYHVQSQCDHHKRKLLYNIVGFEEVNEIKLPPELEKERLTIPDAPKINTVIRLTLKENNSKIYATPVLLYNAERGEGFFNRLYIKLLVIEKKEEWCYVTKNDGAIIIDINDCTDFDSQVGSNTRYNFHPEEILADNFRFMLAGIQVKTPKIIEEMKNIFSK